MTLEELIAQYRQEANDKALPYFFDDQSIIGLLNNAVNEACVRARLIHESVDPDIVDMAVAANQTVCQLHDSVYEIDYIAFTETGSDKVVPLYLISREDLDALDADWRSKEGQPVYAIQSDRSIRLSPKPLVAGTLSIECFRLPKTPMVVGPDAPEIHAEHHRQLVQWVLHKVFSVPDAEFFDKDRAAIALRAFSDYFGLRPDADLRRKTREDVPHHVEAFFV